MTRFNTIYTALLILFMGLGMTACQDDDLGYISDYGEGETIVNLEVAFSPFAEGNLTRASQTQTPPGRGFNDLSDLVILVYDGKGNLLEDYITPVDLSKYQITEDKRFNEDASNGVTAETSTKSVKGIPLKLPFGRYYIIAVSNLGKYKDNNGEITTLISTFDALKNEDLKEKYKTLDGLRSIKVTWDASDFRNNREMSGYFTEGSSSAPSSSSSYQTIMVNKPNQRLHCWLRRCVSKITIDFDGSGLRDNIFIYIKDARIYDRAKECTLGFGTEVSGTTNEVTNYNHSVKNEEGLIDRPSTGSHHWIGYAAPDSEWSNWPCITKGDPYLKDENNEKIDFHTQDSYALYFYENMQGKAPNGKIPVADLTGNGGVAGAGEVQKDGLDLGTYIEVTAHYHSNASGSLGDGEIKYRFMIGKDVIENCDAERNYHYKLTLKIRGNGNDYDWHIDYTKPKGFIVPNPWYVSYLYNHDATMPFDYTPPTGYELKDLSAEIITNPWYPVQLKNLTDTKTEISPTKPTGDDPSAYTETKNRDNGNGFLSLRVTNNTVITDKQALGDGFKWVTGMNGSYAVDTLAHMNRAYYLGKSPSKGTINRAYREYLKDGKEAPEITYPTGVSETDKQRDKFTYTRTTEGGYSFNIPLFTRAKVMVKTTGYSGNNPYVGYQRIARVRLTAKCSKVDPSVAGDEEITEEELVNVIQVRRVVNPKGVYRRSGNNEPFHVRMMWLDGDEAKQFSLVESNGPWSADIIGDPNFITLDGKQTVTGATGSNIDFTIRFNRMNSDKNDKTVRNAVVRIKYHNYTCTHLIFVRQGYAAQDVNPDTKTKWSTFNLLANGVPAKDPRDEGSMFRQGDWWNPIDSYNNAYKIDGVEDYRIPDNFTKPVKLRMAGGDGILTETEMAWSELTSAPKAFSTDKSKVATMKNFEGLYNTVAYPNLQYGYGVLYADGATETSDKVNEAYGYYHGDNADIINSPKGMRGLFIYYWDKNDPGHEYTARNIFFPIGRSGFGHRKNGNEGADSKLPGDGILRYSATRGAANDGFAKVAPFFVSIYRRPGAIYWARVQDSNIKEWNDQPFGAPGYGMDINYFSFDVNTISGTNVGDGKDACFVRCVE